MAKKMFSVIETNAFAIQFIDGSFYNGLDSHYVMEKGHYRAVSLADRVRTSCDTLRTFKTEFGAKTQAASLKSHALSCDVIPVRIGIFPR